MKAVDCIRAGIIVVGVTAIVNFSFHVVAAQTDISPDDVYWTSMSDYPGVDGEVFAMAEFDGKLIIGGKFRAAGNILVNNIVAYDGTNWYPLGLGLNDSVRALKVYDGKLYAGGPFREAGGEFIRGIACWDGLKWSRLGQGLAKDSISWCWIEAINEYHGKLVIGGVFHSGWDSSGRLVDLYNFGTWDGSHWSNEGGVFNSWVKSFAISGGKLYVGGGFSKIGATPATCICSWDGSTWSSLATSFDGTITSIAVTGDSLFVGGDFYSTVGPVIEFKALWNGLTWSAITAPNSGNKYVQLSDTVFALGFGKVTWHDNGTWKLTGDAISGNINVLFKTGGTTYIGGAIAPTNSFGGYALSRLEANKWTSLGRGFTGTLYSVTEIGGKVICGGQFAWTPSGRANSIASYDGSRWDTLGAGIRGLGRTVRKIGAYDGNVVVVGSFDSAGNISTKNIASWDGQSWSPFANGIKGSVYDMGSFQGRLIVVGQFTDTSDAHARSLAVWNGSSWSGELDPGINGYLGDVAMSDSLLFVSGYLNSVDPEPIGRVYVAVWDGFVWTRLDDGPRGTTLALTLFGNDLIVAGEFRSMGGQAAKGIASWDGLAWSPLDTGNNFYVRSLCSHQSDLIVGGAFTGLSGISANGIARWNGTSWNSLGSGIKGTCFSAKSIDNKLYCVGDFAIAGDRPASRLAVWTKGAATPVEDNKGEILPRRFVVSQNYPNPFNPRTTIKYALSYRQNIRIDIYNSVGQRVNTLTDEGKPAGVYRVEWDGTDFLGRRLATGVYFYQMTAGDKTETRKMVLLK